VRGRAIDREAHEPGIIRVAVPILVAGGAVLGGLSIISKVQRNPIAVLARGCRCWGRPILIAAKARYGRFPENA